MREFADENFRFDEIAKSLQTGRKPYWTRRNFLLQAISPYPTVFSKDLCCRHVKTGLVWERVNYTDTSQMTNFGLSEIEIFHRQ